MENQVPNFWNSLEVYCVVAGMDYEKDYLDFHKKGDYRSAPLCKEAYTALNHAIHIQMDHDFKKDPDDFGS